MSLFKTFKTTRLLQITMSSLFSVISTWSLAGALSQGEQDQVLNIIQIFKQQDTDEISQHIRYPLKREQPIPAVQDAAEMQVRFNEVFDPNFVQHIASSSLSQWSSMGWRGVMFENGLLWLDEDKIIAVNHSNDQEQKRKQELLNQQKANIHPSLRNFQQPELVIQTQSFMVRIDQLSDGSYRYASWKKGKPQTTPPDLILKSGQVQFNGSGGNHAFIFQNGKSKNAHYYIVERNVMGAQETPEATLSIMKGNQEILKQSANLVDENNLSF